MGSYAAVQELGVRGEDAATEDQLLLRRQQGSNRDSNVEIINKERYGIHSVVLDIN